MNEKSMDIKSIEQKAPAITPQSAVPSNTVVPSNTISAQNPIISPEDQWLTEMDRRRLASVRTFREKIFSLARMNEYENFGKSQAEKVAFWDEFMKLTPKDARSVMAGETSPKISIEGISQDTLSEEEIRKALLQLWIERKRKGEI